MPLNDTKNNINIPESAVCETGSVPEKVLKLDPTSTDVRDKQIYAALEYVKKNSKPLVIRNTGHDWKGRSSGPGAYTLWTHFLKGMETETEFIPKDSKGVKCENKAAEYVFHFEAGVQWGELSG